MKYYSPKHAPANLVPLFVICLAFLYAFIVSASNKWDPGILILPIMVGPMLFWLSRVIYLRVKKPALEIQSDRIIVQTKWGRFKEVRPFSEYKVVYSTDFFAFRKGKENDISIEKHFIAKEDFSPLQAKLKSMPFTE